jgi:hypothetical protein
MFTLSRFEWLVLAAAVLLCPGLSWSAEPEAGLFDRLDRNKDGYLSTDELAGPESQNGNWIAIDRDRDGRISRAEFGTLVARQPQPSAAAGGSAPPPPKKPQPGKQE